MSCPEFHTLAIFEFQMKFRGTCILILIFNNKYRFAIKFFYVGSALLIQCEERAVTRACNFEMQLICCFESNHHISLLIIHIYNE